MSRIDVVTADSDKPRVLDDYLDLGPFAGEVNRSPRTIRRWLDQPNGLPYSRIGKPHFDSCADGPRVDL